MVAKKKDKKPEKEKAKKLTSNDLLAMPTKSVKSEKKLLVKKEKEKGKEKPKVSIDKLRTVYTVLIDDPLPEIDDEDEEREEIIAAIKKVLK